MTEQKQPEDRWLTSREATSVLRKNAGRENIPDSYIRSLARIGKVETKQLDGRTVLYRATDVETYKVQRRDQGKGKARGTQEGSKAAAV